MKKKLFNAIELKEILDSITANREKIAALKSENFKKFQDWDKAIRKQLVAFKWTPQYNEKVMYIDLESKTARHMWYVQSFTDTHRFREAPADFPGVHDFLRQSIKPLQRNDSHEWVLPLALFEELQAIIPFKVFPDDYKNRNS